MQTEVTSQVYTVTPMHAASLLEKNSCNRALSDKTVSKYAKQMARNKWALNGEPIILNGDGRMLNGQHRAAACVKAGKPFPSLIVSGIDESAFDTMDSGKQRTLADAMSADGIANASSAAAGVRCLKAYEQSETPDTRVLNDLYFVKRDYIDRYHEDAELIQRGILHATRLRGKMQIAKSAMTFCFVIFAGYDEDLAADFFAGVECGRGLAKRDPCYVVRERFLRIGVADKFDMTATEQAAAMFKAFRAFAHNVEIGPRQLAWRRYGPAAEKFPEI